MYTFFLKRTIDLFISIILLFLLSPLLFIIFVGLVIANSGKPFFIQPRPGRKGEVFQVIKFKTMTDEKDSNGNMLPDDVRLTKIGKFVRATSIDELPQLINVMKGDMSLIGPRPVLVEYLPLYSKEQARRHLVRPGITGWAQVNGRNTISWKQKFEYDVWYADHLTFKLDFRISLLTIKKVFFREGINSESNATMETFKGI